MGSSIGQICFLSDERILVTFVSHVVPEMLPRRGEPDVSSNLQLNALFIDAGTALVQVKHEWPTSSERSRITPTTGGKFVVITPDELTLYSPDIVRVKGLELSVARVAAQGDWYAVPSPLGKYLLIWYDPRTSDARDWELVDMRTLHAVCRWGERIGRGYIMPWAPLDDGNILAENETGTGQVVGPPPSGPWRPVQILWGPRCNLSSAGYRPVNDQAMLGWTSVAIDKWCGALGMMSGQIVFEQELTDNEFVGSVAVSAGGQRFAVETYKVHGGSWLLDIGGRASVYRIKVYDIPTRQWIYTLDGKMQHIRSISGLALSPDGSLLGLINQDGILEVYRLPNAGAER